MRVEIAYGKSGIEVEVPDRWHPVVVRGAQTTPLLDPRQSLADALANPIQSVPLAQIVEGLRRDRMASESQRLTAGIAFNDVTRATPNDLIVSSIVEVLLKAGMAPQDITLFNATGTHRTNTPDELRGILGEEISSRFRVVQNECGAASIHTHVGTTKGGNAVRVLTRFLEQDIRIATGFIEPHFFAGYSGGGKAVVPGLADLTTILFNHRAAHMDHPEVTWGRTTGNPLWEDLAEAASFVDPIFLVNVTMNSDKAITGIFAGEHNEAHRLGCAEVERHASVAIDREFDIVLTSNSGFPLDLNLYQAGKGMSAAARVVRTGGEVVMAAECWDGIPDHGLFAQLLAEAGTPEELLERVRSPKYRVQDAWEAHILALVRTKARVTVVSEGLQEADLPPMIVEKAKTVEEALSIAAERIDGTPSLCILPDGPLTIPVATSPASAHP